MKTYLLDILNRYKRFSENLDVRAVLCNKSWWIFNDSGEKEVYIFQEDGSLIVSYGGKVTPATWRYIPANKSLVISTNEDAYMLRPAFVNEEIFALQQDGTNKFAFMIDESRLTTFAPRTLAELTAYFESIERKRIEEEQRHYIEILRAEEQQLLELRQKAREVWLRTEDEKIYKMRTPLRKEAEQMWQANMRDVLGNKTYRAYKKYQVVILLGVLLIAAIACCLPVWEDGVPWQLLLLGFIIIIAPYVWFFGVIDEVKSRKKEYIIEYMRERLGEDGQK